MASKAKTLQVKDKEKDDKAADAPEKDSPDAPSPLLDLSDAAVKKMIKQAKKRGFVTFDQLNEVLPSDTTSPEQIEDIMSMLSDMGINVSEAEDADSEEEAKEEADDETDNELVEVTQKAVTEVKKSEPGERTDDPVRMYLREMGTVELLSREGEIAIAKRIEAGREAMIAGLCESPLTFQAIIIWRDELNEGKIFLRDIIDLEATYAGPDAKNNMNPLLSAPVGADGQPLADANGEGAAMPAAVAPPAAPPAPTPFRAAPAAAPGGDGEEKDPAEAAAEGDMDDDEFENQMSLAAIEAELKPKVVETFDKIADNYKKLRRLQEQDISNQLQNETLSPAQERKYKKLKDEIIVEVKSLRLNQARIDSAWSSSSTTSTRSWSRSRAACCASATATASPARTSFATTRAPSSIRAGSTASRNCPPRAGRISSITKRTASRSCATRSSRWPRSPGSRSANSARSCTACRRASARRARPRRKWSRPIFVS